MENPIQLAVVAAELDWPARICVIAAKAKASCRERRGAVLRYPDLAARLCQPPLNFRRPDNWNGFIPPHIAVVDDDGERLRQTMQARNGRLSFWCNPHGKRSPGDVVNDSACRTVLLEISMEAWKREHPDSPAASGRPGPGAPALAAAASSPSALSSGSSPGSAGAMSFPASSESGDDDHR